MVLVLDFTAWVWVWGLGIRVSGWFRGSTLILSMENHMENQVENQLGIGIHWRIGGFILGFSGDKMGMESGEAFFQKAHDVCMFSDMAPTWTWNPVKPSFRRWLWGPFARFPRKP